MGREQGSRERSPPFHRARRIDAAARRTGQCLVLAAADAGRRVNCIGGGGKRARSTSDPSELAGAAAFIAELDLIVTVDTSIAHLAGALAKPTWLLLPFPPDWRWQLTRTDNWRYPTARLFRQPRPSDWDAVVRDVAAALVEHTSAGALRLSGGA